MTDTELISRVATEVMGWHLSTAGTYRKNCEILIMSPEGNTIDVLTFDPLTNANHWMMVMEKMRKDGWILELTSDTLVVGKQGWNVWIYKRDEDGYGEIYVDGEATHTNLGYAVCIAALKAKEAN